MRTRKIVFISGKQGAWIPVQDIPNPHVEVRGLKNGRITIVRSMCKQALSVDSEVVTEQDGLTRVAPCLWLRILYEGNCKQVLCHVVNKRAA